MNWPEQINQVVCADVLDYLSEIPDAVVQTCITSPPFWGLRDYGVEGQLGLEATPEEYVAKMVEIFREVRRVLRDDGCIWVNLGDSYAGSWGNYHPNSPPGKHGQRLKETQRWNRPSYKDKAFLPPTATGPGLKPKDLCMIPARVALALQADGWWLRSAIVWAKGLSFCDTYAGSVMPESVTDRPTSAYEMVYLLTKSDRCYYDHVAVREKSVKGAAGSQYNTGKTAIHQEGRASDAVREDGDTRNLRNVWVINPEPFSGWTKSYSLQRVSLDAVACGMIHIPFPNCPVHEGLFDRVAKGFCDEHPRIDHSALSLHNPHTDDCLDQGQVNDSESTAQPRARCSALQNSDSNVHKCSVSAIVHSNQIHKTDPALETNLSYTLFAERLLHIADKSERLAFFVHHANMTGSSILPDVMDVHLQDQIPSRIVDKSSLLFPHNCVCAIYDRKAKKTSHFATFPTKLVEPCILAGTSEKGQCPECGKPWVRIIEKVPTGKTQKMGDGWATHEGGHGSIHRDGRESGESGKSVTELKTLGWRPQCECPGEPVPQIVLDPFCGKGTTAKRAKELGREYLTCDLNEEYCELARQELSQRELF